MPIFHTKERTVHIFERGLWLSHRYGRSCLIAEIFTATQWIKLFDVIDIENDSTVQIETAIFNYQPKSLCAVEPM